MAYPQERVIKAIKPQSYTHQQWESDEQGCSRVAEWAGVLPVSTWVDDLKRMQRGVVGLYKQHR